MNNKIIDDMIEGRESRYSLVIAVAKRARQIVKESEKSGKILIKKPVNLAVDDFKEHKFSIIEPEVNN